ncbi:hypothetical protein BDV96DRAFT_23404 [Lophiotrema nucula]|uniref:Uncharacterized protein n=1 Tax=Lophiotrema nucula TaxID=690887 RepID=A0A6A5ZCQ3_9PLEO|nr:hypothetical protein BDV96DRAFT_23404 [Lophiotrema nucula]
MVQRIAVSMERWLNADFYDTGDRVYGDLVDMGPGRVIEKTTVDTETELHQPRSNPPEDMQFHEQDKQSQKEPAVPEVVVGMPGQRASGRTILPATPQRQDPKHPMEWFLERRPTPMPKGCLGAGNGPRDELVYAMKPPRKEPVPPKRPNPATFKHPTENSTRTGLPIVVETREGYATIMSCADTGADENIIAQSMIELLQLPLETPSLPRNEFMLANGGIIRSIGTVLIKLGFSSEYPSRLPSTLLRFHVFPTAAMSMIIGRPFLVMSHTMTDFRSRLSRFSYRPQVVSSHFVQAVGQQRQRLLCTLNGRKILALPDSGADLSLMSGDYARRHELEIQDERIRLVYADNKEGFAVGSVIVLVSFQTSQEVLDNVVESSERLVRLKMSNECWARFYVVERLVEEVILGADFLEDHRVLESSRDAFIDLPDTPELLSNVHGILHLNKAERKIARGVHRLRKKLKKSHANVTQTNLEEQIEVQDQQENARREKEDLRIMAIEALNDRIRAHEAEFHIRQVYESNRRQKLAGQASVI